MSEAISKSMVEAMIAELEKTSDSETRVSLIERLNTMDGELFGANRMPDHPVRQLIEDLFHRLQATGNASDKAAVNRFLEED